MQINGTEIRYYSIKSEDNIVRFRHYIFCNEDDRVEVYLEREDSTLELFLIFTANLYILNSSRQQIGYISSEYKDVYTQTVATIKHIDNSEFKYSERYNPGKAEFFIDFEVNLVKQYFASLG